MTLLLDVPGAFACAVGSGHQKQVVLVIDFP